VLYERSWKLIQLYIVIASVTMVLDLLGKLVVIFPCDYSLFINRFNIININLLCVAIRRPICDVIISLLMSYNLIRFTFNCRHSNTRSCGNFQRFCCVVCNEQKY